MRSGLELESVWLRNKGKITEWLKSCAHKETGWKQHSTFPKGSLQLLDVRRLRAPVYFFL